MGFTVVGLAVFDGSAQAAFEWNGVVDVEAVSSWVQGGDDLGWRWMMINTGI